MLKNNKGFSLTVLVIALVVIIIISSTAVITIKSISKDRAISEFMTDLSDVNQFIVEYVSRDGTLPVDESRTSTEAQNAIFGIARDQISEDDVGNYYFVDLTKLGKIHLSNTNRGYIFNEGTLKVYVQNPVEYNGVSYYTLTKDLVGRVNYTTEEPLEIVITGNPMTWVNKAEILVSVSNYEVNNDNNWNFKWAEGSRDSEYFKTADTVHYFTYGETISLTKNGVYTICIEQFLPIQRIVTRKIVVDKIDDIPPKINMVSNKLVIDDSETGIRSIRCKIKETPDFPISNADRSTYTAYYTSHEEGVEDSAEVLLDYYLGDANKKGDTIDSYLQEYEKYYKQLSLYNRIISSTSSESGEIANAKESIKVLNDSYPQFAYKNRTFPDKEENIVIYAEDMNGNATVYSAISRNQLASLEYVSQNNGSIEVADALLNNGEEYTNSGDITIFMQTMHAKYYFATETRDATPDWKEYKENVHFTLSDDDGLKNVYVFFKDVSNRITAVTPVPHIILDTNKPNTEKPDVVVSETSLSITPKQTDLDVVQNVSTQSGLSFRYGIRESSGAEGRYTWYSKVSSIPNLDAGKTYYIVTEATDKAGNKQISEPTEISVDEVVLNDD